MESVSWLDASKGCAVKEYDERIAKPMFVIFLASTFGPACLVGVEGPCSDQNR